MKKKVSNMKKCCTFATSIRNNFFLIQLIVNKPFRRAFGSILEGRFSFYKAANSFVSL